MELGHAAANSTCMSFKEMIHVQFAHLMLALVSAWATSFVEDARFDVP